jgi:hypothetical protein
MQSSKTTTVKYGALLSADNQALDILRSSLNFAFIHSSWLEYSKVD